MLEVVKKFQDLPKSSQTLAPLGSTGLGWVSLLEVSTIYMQGHALLPQEEIDRKVESYEKDQ